MCIRDSFQSFDFSLSKNLSNLKNAISFSINTDPVLNAASLVALGPFILACNTSCNFSFGDVPIGGCTTFCVAYRASNIICSSSPLINGGGNPAAFDIAFLLLR